MAKFGIAPQSLQSGLVLVNPVSCTAFFLLVISAQLMLPAAVDAAHGNPRWSIIADSNSSADEASLEYYVQVEVGGEDTGELLPALDSNTTNNFGAMEVFALNVTEGADASSTQLGVIRGYTVQASYTSTSHEVEVEVLSYDDGSVNGTISLQGLINQATNEIAVVGGTGAFRGVRGYGIISFVNATGTLYLYHHSLYFL